MDNRSNIVDIYLSFREGEEEGIKRKNTLNCFAQMYSFCDDQESKRLMQSTTTDDEKVSVRMVRPLWRLGRTICCRSQSLR